MSSRCLTAAASVVRRFVANRSNRDTKMSSPQSRTSCHRDCSSNGTSLSGMSLAARATSRVCGTFSPRNSSPSPYSPRPVLKNRISTCRCSSLRSDSMYSVISLAVVMAAKVRKVCDNDERKEQKKREAAVRAASRFTSNNNSKQSSAMVSQSQSGGLPSPSAPRA